MKYGISIPAFADFSDPRVLAETAHEAEMAGWDAFFIWDHIFFDPTFHPIADPWVALAAVALSTQTMRIGTLITPLARRRQRDLHGRAKIRQHGRRAPDMGDEHLFAGARGRALPRLANYCLLDRQCLSIAFFGRGRGF